MQAGHELIIYFSASDDDAKSLECWICYDPDRMDCGPMIQPCNCKGDVGAVHHDCLRRWLVEVIIWNFHSHLQENFYFRVRIIPTPSNVRSAQCLTWWKKDLSSRSRMALPLVNGCRQLPSSPSCAWPWEPLGPWSNFIRSRGYACWPSAWGFWSNTFVWGTLIHT